MILVVDHEVLLLSMQRHFSPDDYELAHAVSEEQARLMASIRSLRLVVVKASKKSDELALALADITANRVAVLGVLPTEGIKGVDVSVYTDTAPADDLSAISGACRKLLEERRAEPRVGIQFPVLLQDTGEGIVQNITASSLLVNSMMPLSTGEDITVQVGWGLTPLRFSAMVGQGGRASHGQRSMVLLVPLDETEARHFLKGLSDRVLELHHYLALSAKEPTEEDANLEDLADQYGLVDIGPGPINISVSQPAPGPPLPEAQFLTTGDAEEPDGEQEEEEDSEPEEPAREHKKEGLDAEELFGREVASPRSRDGEQEPKRKDARDGEDGDRRGGKKLGNSGTWALTFVIAAVLLVVVLWPRISRWQRQGAAPRPVAAMAPDAGEPAEPDASPEEIALSSESRQSLMEQGRALLARKRHKQAVQALDQALFLEDGEDVRRLLAKAYRSMGRRDRAIEHYEYLAQRAPEVAWFPDMIGRLQQELGKRDLACAAFRKATEVDPGYKAAQRNLKRHCGKDKPPRKKKSK